MTGRPKRHPIPRARDAWTWLGGTALLGVLGAGVVAGAVVLWENIDVRRLAPQLGEPPPPLPSPEPTEPAARPPRAFEAVLFDSPRNRAYFPDATHYDSELASWEDLLRESGGVVRRVGTATELRTLTPSDVLVLAEAPCLSDAEARAVRSHLARAGGLVASWAVGVRGASCAWQGWDLMADITGADDVRELSPGQSLHLTVPGGVALSAGFAPGTRIELRPDPPLALRLSGPRVYWSDWALNPVADPRAAGADVAATANRSASGGRVAWFGARLGQAVAPADSVHLRRLMQNGVLWAAGVPTAAPASWPGGRTAALVVSIDVEDEPRNAVATADLLRGRGLQGTFYAVSQLVLEDAPLAAALASAGEIGTQTSDHTPVAGLARQDQRVRLRRSWTDIEDWAGLGPSGLHPPEDRFDGGTLAAWAAAGGTYLLATNGGRSASPEIHRVDDARMVVLPRLLKDDYNLIVQDRIIRSAALAQAYLAGIRKQRAIGGLAVVAGHTQIMRPGSRIAALGEVLDTARAQTDWWITSAVAVANWWSARADTRLSFVPPVPIERSGVGASDVADLVVDAPDARGLADLWVDVVLPRAVPGLIPLVDGAPVGFTATDWGIRVPVGELPPGGTRRLSFVVVDDEGGAAAPVT